MAFSIVEFSDGINLVATCWLSADQKLCYWPLIENTSIYSKIVSSQVMPRQNDQSWELYPVKKILCKAATYQDGIVKLKNAERYTNLKSASDGDSKAKRAKRQERSKQQLYKTTDSTPYNYEVCDSDSVDEVSYGSQSIVDDTKHIIKEKLNAVVMKSLQSTENYIDDHDLFMEFPILMNSTPNISKTRAVENTKINQRRLIDTPSCSYEINESIKHFSLNLSQKSPNSSDKVVSEKDVYKMLSKVHSELIQIHEKVIDTKECSLEQRKSDVMSLNGLEPLKSVPFTSFEPNLPISTNNQLNTTGYKLNEQASLISLNGLEPLKSMPFTSFEPNLPFSTNNQLQTTEYKLNEQAYFTLVVNDLKRLGGTDPEDILYNALAHVISDELACDYSWKGKGSKRSFSGGFKMFNKTLLTLARCTKADLTNQTFDTIIAKWLRQAPQRKKRKEVKRENAKRLLQIENNEKDQSTISDDALQSTDNFIDNHDLFPEFPTLMNATPNISKTRAVENTKIENQKRFTDTLSCSYKINESMNHFSLNSSQKITNASEKVFCAKDVYKMLSKVYSELIQIHTVIQTKECSLVQCKSNVISLNGLEPLKSMPFTSFEPNLPFSTNNQLQTTEYKLNEQAYFTLVVNDLKRLGGTDPEDILYNALAHVISDELACDYSWKGKGSKRSFSRGFKMFNKTLLTLARCTKADLTNQTFDTIIAKWLRQAPQRKKRKEKKRENARSLLQIENNEKDLLTISDDDE